MQEKRVSSLAIEEVCVSDADGDLSTLVTSKRRASWKRHASLTRSVSRCVSCQSFCLGVGSRTRFVLQEFNSHLDSLSEHYDIPKVSWTK